jgi:hypothetical protein
MAINPACCGVWFEQKTVFSAGLGIYVTSFYDPGLACPYPDPRGPLTIAISAPSRHPGRSTVLGSG